MKKLYITAIKSDFNYTRLQVTRVVPEGNKAIIYLAKPERIRKEKLMIDNYDFENSKLAYILANEGFKSMILVDKMGNPIKEFNILER